MICMFIRYVPNHLIILIQNDISIMCVMHVIRIKRSIPCPSVIVLSVMRDILVMHVMRNETKLYPLIKFVLGLIPVIRVMQFTHVVKFGHFRSIIIIMSVMCVMRVVSYDKHVMSLIPFLLKTVYYSH